MSSKTSDLTSKHYNFETLYVTFTQNRVSLKDFQNEQKSVLVMCGKILYRYHLKI